MPRIGLQEFPELHRWLTMARPTAPSASLLFQGATVRIETNFDDKHGAGTGFLIETPPPDATCLSDYLIVTARHNVDAAALRGADVIVELRDYARERTIRETIPGQEWFCPSYHDVAVTRLPLRVRIASPALYAVPAHHLFVNLTWRFPLPCEMFGLVRVGQTDVVLTRMGFISTPAQPMVLLENFTRRVPIIVIEGSVTPGMSGGPIMSAGFGEEPPALVGLLHGYDNPLPSDDALDHLDDQPETLKRTIQRMRREMQALRQQLIYGVPSKFIVNAINSFFITCYPDREQRLGQLV